MIRASRRLFLGLSAVLLSARGTMSQTQPDKTLWFRMMIGAADVAHPVKPGPGAVLARWPALPELIGLGSGWTVTEDYVMPPNGQGFARHYAATHGRETIRVEVFSSGNGFPGSVDRLVQIATTTMRAMPPYEKAPDALRLGEVAVVSVDPEYRTLIWTFHGLCLSVESTSGGEATMGPARRLLDYLTRHLTDEAAVAKERPRLSLPAGELTVAMGGTFRITPAEATTGLTLAVYPSTQAVAVLTARPDLLEFRAVARGRTTISVVLADPVTLLCNAGQVVVVSH